MTEPYVREAYGDLRGCLAALKSGGGANSVDVKSVQNTTGVAATRKTVRLIPAGGPNDGETLTVSLVAGEDGRWQVDAVHSNAPVGP